MPFWISPVEIGQHYSGEVSSGVGANGFGAKFLMLGK